ncbi:MAG: hypothetical protein Q9187_004737, partial [Circinaria calcarea]
MSSRALRKLQREQEEQQQQQRLASPQEDRELEGSDDDRNEGAELESSLTKKFNAFDVLNLTGADEGDTVEDSQTARSTDAEDNTTIESDKQKDPNTSL